MKTQAKSFKLLSSGRAYLNSTDHKLYACLCHVWWRYSAMYDQTVDHTPQARRTMKKVKSQQREQA